MLEYVLYLQLLGGGQGLDRLKFSNLYPQEACMAAGKKLVEAMPDKTQAAFWCEPDPNQLAKLIASSATKDTTGRH